MMAKLIPPLFFVLWGGFQEGYCGEGEKQRKKGYAKKSSEILR